MLGETAVRPRITPISSAMPANRWWAISSVTGSTLAMLALEQQRALLIDAQPPARGNNGRRAVLADDGGTGDASPAAERLAMEGRRRVRAPGENHSRGPERSWPPGARDAIEWRQRARRAGANPERDDLERAGGVTVSEQAAMLGHEPPSPPRSGRDGDLVGLSAVAHVEPALEHHPVHRRAE